MLHIQKILIVVMISIISVGCTVKTPLVEKLVKSKNGTGYEKWMGDGVVYSLPKLDFEVQFEVSRTDFDSPKCDAKTLTKDQLDAMDIDPKKTGKKYQHVYSLHSTVVKQNAVSDPDRAFIARFPESSMWMDSSLLIKMGPQGIVESTESSVDSKAAEIGSSVLELTAKVGAAVIAFGVAAPHPRDKICQSSAEKFIALNQELAAYRASPTPYAKDTLEQYAGEIKAEQDVILSLYLGKPTVSKGNIICNVSPNNVGQIKVLSLYPLNGFRPEKDADCALDDKFTGHNLNDKWDEKAKSEILLKIELAENVIGDAYSAKLNESIPTSAGFFYAIPARTYVSMTGHSKAKIDRQTYLIPQLGKLGTLPQVEGSHPALIVELHPETGALKTVKVVHNAADFPGLIGTAGTSISSILAAETAAKGKEDAAAKATADKLDPLAILNREKALLESELAIAIAKDALNQLKETE